MNKTLIIWLASLETAALYGAIGAMGSIVSDPAHFIANPRTALMSGLVGAAIGIINRLKDSPLPGISSADIQKNESTPSTGK